MTNLIVSLIASASYATSEDLSKKIDHERFYGKPTRVERLREQHRVVIDAWEDALETLGRLPS